MTLQKMQIDRRTWLRGEGYKESFLLREGDGKMCCMGSWCLFSGNVPSEIRGFTTIAKFNSEVGFNIMHPDPTLRLPDRPFEPLVSAYMINDSTTISDELREKLLKEVFLNNGIDVKFVN